MGLRLFFLTNFPGATFIQGATFFPDSKAGPDVLCGPSMMKQLETHKGSTACDKFDGPDGMYLFKIYSSIRHK